MPRTPSHTGVAYAVAAYLSWGLLPVYFRGLRHVPAPELLAHRVVWSLVFLGGLLTLRRAWGAVTRERLRGTARTFLTTTVLLATNWLLYLWAITSGNVLEASLGYFVTPLVNVLLGMVFLGESLTRAQKVAVALAAAGVAVQLLGAGRLPWVALTLAGTFGLYGLLRKRLVVDAVPALFVETAMMTGPALVWLAITFTRGGNALAAPFALDDALLLGTGVVTAVPLLFFANAARRLRLTTLGLVQYLSPTCQLLLAVLVFGEPFGPAHAVTFTLIWAALLVYTADAVVRVRAARTA
ncbi:MAG: EamA family transporter RarD [Myxococcota bacterium]